MFSNKRIRKKIDELQEYYDLLSDKVKHFLKAHAIESDETKRFELGELLDQAKKERDEVEQELEELENQLTRRIQLILEGDFDEFDETQQDKLIYILCSILNIDRKFVRILNISQGSIKLVLELQEKDAQDLVGLFKQGNKRIQPLVTNFSVKDIEIINDVIDERVGFPDDKIEKPEVHFYAPVEGVVIGDNNTVTIRFTSGQQQTVPFLAPAKFPYSLVGRDSFLFNLKQRLLAEDHPEFLALYGPLGIGKTTLSLELAYDKNLLEHFPDGVLWANLGENADLFQILGDWLLALDVHEKIIEELITLRDRLNRLQAMIGKQRMLLFIDDVHKAPDMLYFRVGGPNCAHLLTTKERGIALEFAGENNSMLVKRLETEESLKLLKQFARFVIEQHSEEIRELIHIVDNLPRDIILLGKYLRKESLDQNPNRILQALETLKTAAQQETLHTIISR